MAKAETEDSKNREERVIEVKRSILMMKMRGIGKIFF